MKEMILLMLSMATTPLAGCSPSPDSGDTDSGETGETDVGAPFDIVDNWNVRGAIPGQPNTEDWCAQATPEDYPDLDGGDCWVSDDFCTSNLIFDEDGGVDWKLRINVILCGETESESLRATIDYGTWAYQYTLSEDTAVFEVADMDWTIRAIEAGDLDVQAGEYVFELE